MALVLNCRNETVHAQGLASQELRGLSDHSASFCTQKQSDIHPRPCVALITCNQNDDQKEFDWYIPSVSAQMKCVSAGANCGGAPESDVGFSQRTGGGAQVP